MSRADFPTRLVRVWTHIRNVVDARCRFLHDQDWTGHLYGERVFAYEINDSIEDIPIDWLFRGCLQAFDMPAGRLNDRPFSLLFDYELQPFGDYIQQMLGDHFAVFISERKHVVSVVVKLKRQFYQQHTAINVRFIERKRFLMKRNYRDVSHDEHDTAKRYRNNAGVGVSVHERDLPAQPDPLHPVSENTVIEGMVNENTVIEDMVIHPQVSENTAIVTGFAFSFLKNIFG